MYNLPREKMTILLMMSRVCATAASPSVCCHTTSLKTCSQHTKTHVYTIL